MEDVEREILDLVVKVRADERAKVRHQVEEALDRYMRTHVNGESPITVVSPMGAVTTTSFGLSTKDLERSPNVEGVRSLNRVILGDIRKALIDALEAEDDRVEA